LFHVRSFCVWQDHLREAGCLPRLQQLIVHPDLSVKLAAVRTTGNLALNTSNQAEMEVPKSRFLFQHSASN
jgi:hypothetical protein